MGKVLNPRQIAVLRAAPIGVDDDSNGDPARGGRFRYQGADGRTASALWQAGLLSCREVSPHGNAGGLLVLTEAGRLALAQADGGVEP